MHLRSQQLDIHHFILLKIIENVKNKSFHDKEQTNCWLSFDDGQHL